ncbi:MAG TPA: hypothetical protein DDY57_14615, partial [Franconibacter pulveris]|nr:hypothetical protein [Franconibacter pulveris]
AMFLVGGGIVVHGLTPVHHAIEHWAEQGGHIAQAVVPTLMNLVLGFIVGAVVLAVVKGINCLRGKEAH